MKTKFIIVFVFFFYNISFSQNIFDLNNSLKYAEYLFDNEEYNKAAEEYERIVFLAPDSTSFKEKLILTYYKSTNYNKAFEKINVFFPNKNLFTPFIAEKYLQIIFINNEISEAEDFLNSTNVLENNIKQNFQLAYFILSEKYGAANLYVQNVFDNDEQFEQLKDILILAENQKYKKPITAVFLSTIIPGSGKVYTKDYYDGLVAFSAVGINFWQAFSAYQKSGIKSPYTIGFGVLASGFYIGNIYGSFTSTKRYNARLKENIRRKVLDVILYN